MIEVDGYVSSPVLLSGSHILNGDGIVIVFAVGENKFQSKVAKVVKLEFYEATPLQKKLESLARDVGYRGAFCAFAVFIAMAVRLIVNIIRDRHWQGQHIDEILEFYILSTCILVIALPEGLPILITLASAYSTENMLKDQCMIRKIQASESIAHIN